MRRRGRRYAARDTRSENEFAVILDYAERARHGDEDAREVLHDALLSRYPRVYGNLVRLAESPLGKGRVVDRGSVIIEGRQYNGHRLILLNPKQLAAAEAGVREPRQPPLPSGWTVSRLFDLRLSRAFDVVVDTGHGTPAGDNSVVTYVSRRTEGLIGRSIRRMIRAERAANRVAKRAAKRDPTEKRKRPYERHEHRVMDKRTLRRMALQAIGRPDISQGPLHDALLEAYPIEYTDAIRYAEKAAKTARKKWGVVFVIRKLSKRSLARDETPFYEREVWDIPNTADYERTLIHFGLSPRVITYITRAGKR